MDYQDYINDLATAARKRFVEQVAAQGFLMACESNKVEVTEALLKPYSDAFNEANAECYRIMRRMGKWTGKMPIMRFSSTRKCDVRCTSAKGFDCSCSCGGINHGIDALPLFPKSQGIHA